MDDPETLEYLRAEIPHAEAVMAPEEQLRERLYQEMGGRTKEDDSTVPEREGDYYYYTRCEEGRQHPIRCREHLSLDASEEILIDVNELAKDMDYCRLMFRVQVRIAPTPDSRLLLPSGISVFATESWWGKSPDVSWLTRT